jgi:hypothetical protein
VEIKVNDTDGAGSNTDSVAVTVSNVTPTVILTGPAAADEGQTKSYSYTVTDPGQDTFAAAAGFPACGTGGDLVGGSHSTTTSGGSFQCKFPDGPASPSVEIKVTDSDGAASNVSLVSVTVSNVAPTINLTGPATADEGQTKTYAYTVTDPGQDTFAAAAGFPSCGTGGDLVTGSHATTASGGSFQCSFPDGPANPSVQIKVTDSDGAASNVSTVAVTVANVAPTVSLTGAEEADEGQTKSYSYTVTDPGQDTFTVASGFPNCGTGGDVVTGSQSTTATGGSFQCKFPDGPASPQVQIKVNDSDGAGSNTDSVDVIVHNVAPTVSLTGPTTADEGQSKTYSYTVTDPGQDGFTAASGFPSCGTGGSVVSGSHATTASGGGFNCRFADGPASPSVQMKVNDTDGAASNVDSVAVTVSNVKPTITSFAGTGSLSGPLVFAPSTFTGTFTDPGLVDNPWVVSWKWDGAADPTTQSVGANGTNTHSFGPTTHTFSSAGCSHSAEVKITDKDGAYDTASTTVSVGTGAFLPPMTNQPVTDKLRNGQVLPVKVEIQDCNGQPVTNLQPAIQLKRGDLTQSADDSLVTITPESVSSADTNGVMRLVDGHYQYNMRVNLPTADVGVADYTVMIYPYGLGNPSQTLRHVIRATK